MLSNSMRSFVRARYEFLKMRIDSKSRAGAFPAMKSPVKLWDKKVYEEPKFFKYGTLTEMTAADHSVE